MPSRLVLFASLLLILPANAAPVDPAITDPAKISDPDFTRVDPRSWRGLTVRRVTASDGPVTWNIWRIANHKHRRGPLWVVPHDNENAAFAAGVVAVKRWGGVMIAVDSGADDTTRAARFIMASDGRRIDPNRSFTSEFPNFSRTVLAALDGHSRPIIALHTNAPGLDPDLPVCGTSEPAAGSGDISIRLCNETYTPRPASKRDWPWDDDDSVTIIPYRDGEPMTAGWCARELQRGNFNLTFERVTSGDGSLSNYAARYGLAYLNFETRDLGAAPDEIVTARKRMTAMIDAAMKRCRRVKVRLVKAPLPDKSAE